MFPLVLLSMAFNYIMNRVIIGLAYQKIQITLQQSQLRDFLMSSQDSIFAFDEESRELVFKNKAAAKLFELEDEDVNPTKLLFTKITMDQESGIFASAGQQPQVSLE